MTTFFPSKKEKYVKKTSRSICQDGFGEKAAIKN
jgi:hypothetical protein